jgi:hypothetical protein
MSKKKAFPAGKTLRVKDDPKLEATIARIDRRNAEDLTKARLFFRDGSVNTYADQKLAYAIWLGLPNGVCCAFRGIGDATPVYSHDYVDRR